MALTVTSCDPPNTAGQNLNTPVILEPCPKLPNATTVARVERNYGFDRGDSAIRDITASVDVDRVFEFLEKHRSSWRLPNNPEPDLPLKVTISFFDAENYGLMTILLARGQVALLCHSISSAVAVWDVDRENEKKLRSMFSAGT